MAMIDYGAIAFKNGKLISTGMFTPMEETCGFTDKEEENHYDGNYFVVLGNKELKIGFYKEQIHWHSTVGEYESGEVYFNCSDYYGWKSWEKDLWHFNRNNSVVHTTIYVKRWNGYYIANFNFEGDKYKVYFGYGVDHNWYKKTHLVNFYRTNPKFLWSKFKDIIRIEIRNWEYVRSRRKRRKR